MKKLFVCIIFLIGLGSVSAQSFVKHFPQGKNILNISKGNEQLKILAVMVDFQEDKYDATVGNGKFGSIYSQDYGDTIIDPLPHNADYFSDHLEFAKNYFKKVSRGKVNIEYNVLPEVLTVSKYMRNYVPEYNTTNFTPLGNFAKEVWELADSKFSNVNFSDYNVFVIFHAGVSAGIDLGTFTIDRNMPSIFLSESALRNIFGSDFKGIPVNQNSSFVTNSIIMSETESREFSDIQNKIYLTQFSINGALVNNIASYLGLPDLFNTEIGRSAIGRFGLMDSQGMNANYGMFPPEPSPWEKIYLGWETPVTISPSDLRINIADRVTASLTDTTLVKIPINSSEYFLIENRQQDALKNYCRITYKLHGSLFTQTVKPDTNGIFYITPDSIYGGVVVDVDEFDAAVPGNGIVIWHIDENIINQNFADNKINEGDVKGIYVEEADGITDIGQLFYSIFGTVIGEGNEEDFWYKGNKAKLYKNRFSSDTKPNSNSNYGAKSLITLDNFSAIGNKMGFNVGWGDESINLVSRKNTSFGNTNRMITSINSDESKYVILLENSDLFVYDFSGNLITKVSEFSDVQPVSFNLIGLSYIVGAKNNSINIFSTTSVSANVAHIPFQGEVTSLSIKGNQTFPDLLIALWDSGCYCYQVPFNEIILKNSIDKNSYLLYQGNFRVKEFAVGPGRITISGNDNFIVHSNIDESISLDGKIIKSVLSKSNSGNYISTILLDGNRFVNYESGTGTTQFKINSSSAIESFAVSDLLGNGKNYILLNNGKNIEAYDFNGVLAENFPFTLNTNEKFVGTPLVADIDNDGDPDIISVTDIGNIYAINASTTKIMNSFPISCGEKITANPVLIPDQLPGAGTTTIYQPYLSVLTENNDLYVWQIGNIMGKGYWFGEYGDSYNSNFANAPQASSTETEFFPLAKAYNWPNPVYGNETNIRYFVSENSEVNIKIFDLAGDFVAELNSHAIGGFDNETKWNVSNIQSGVYFARVYVKSDIGKSAEKIIKIAVIK